MKLYSVGFLFLGLADVSPLSLERRSFLDKFHVNKFSYNKGLGLFNSSPVTKLSKLFLPHYVTSNSVFDFMSPSSILSNLGTGLKSAKDTIGNKAKDFNSWMKELPSKSEKNGKFNPSTLKNVKEQFENDMDKIQKKIIKIKNKVTYELEGGLKVVKKQSSIIRKKISKAIPEELEKAVFEFQKGLERIRNSYGDDFEEELRDNFAYLENKYSDVDLKRQHDDTVTNQVSSIFEAKYKSLFAATSYCNLTQIRDWTCSRCQLIKNITEVRVFEDHFTNTQGYVAVNHWTKEIIVAFRGSSNLKNWIQNSKALPVDYRVEPWVKVQVHSGFKQCMEGLSPYYIPLVKKFFEKYPDYRLSLIGHSLGGAVASLASVDLKNTLGLTWDRIELTTYGQPRVGNLDWAKWFNKLGMTSTRVVNSKDIVPNLPPRIALYAHFYSEMILVEELDGLKSTDYKKIGPNVHGAKTNSFFDVNKHLNFWGIHLGSGC